MQDVLDILKERGLVDDGQYTALSAKNLAYEEEQQGLLWSDPIQTSLPAFETSVADSERIRLRTDVIVKF